MCTPWRAVSRSASCGTGCEPGAGQLAQSKHSQSSSQSPAHHIDVVEAELLHRLLAARRLVLDGVHVVRDVLDEHLVAVARCAHALAVQPGLQQRALRWAHSRKAVQREPHGWQYSQYLESSTKRSAASFGRLGARARGQDTARHVNARHTQTHAAVGAVVRVPAEAWQLAQTVVKRVRLRRAERQGDREAHHPRSIFLRAQHQDSSPSARRPHRAEKGTSQTDIIVWPNSWF
jgi:hypothetical protein